MGAVNTTGNQDRSLDNAESFADAIKRLDADSISEVIEIVHNLDRQISNWKECSECGTPEELLRELSRLRGIEENQQ